MSLFIDPFDATTRSTPLYLINKIVHGKWRFYYFTKDLLTLSGDVIKEYIKQKFYELKVILKILSLDVCDFEQNEDLIY